MMKKIIYFAILMAMGVLVKSIGAQEVLPNPIQEMVLKDLGFHTPIEKSFTSQLFVSRATWGSVMFELDAERTGRGAKTGLWRNKFFIPNGYLRKLPTKSDRGEFDWGEYNQMWVEGVEDLVPTEKLRPHLRKTQGGMVIVPLAKRVLKSIDYINKWKLNDLDTWSFTFTYFLEPVLSDLPRLGPFEGKGTAMINPATGKFDTVFEKDVGRRYGSSLGDNDDNEYTAWLEGRSISSKPESLPSAETSSPKTSEAPEKITIASLTKDIPDTNHFVAQSKVFDAPFEIVWAGANRYLAKQGEITTVDPSKGILITEGSTGNLKIQIIALIEKDSENSTKVTVKGFCYEYATYKMGWRYQSRWERSSGAFCSKIALKGIGKEVDKELERKKEQSSSKEPSKGGE